MKLFSSSSLLRPTNLAGLLLAGSLLAGCAGAPTSAPAADAQPQAETAAQADTSASVAMQDGTKLNVNTATEEEFLTIPNVGEKMVDEFMEYRPFVSIAQFRQDMGKYVDNAQIAEYEQYLFVPVSANDSDSATLQQLPGVDEAMAEELIAGRPYADDAAFMEALGGLISADDLAAAAPYVNSDMATMAEETAVTDHAKLNVNTATEEEFATIPNIGEKMIDEFMEYRPFLSIAQFRQDMSKYVDDAQIAAYEEYLFVPVNPNEADSATLQQLPDVDETMAEELIAGRPYADDAAFLEVLAQHLSESEVEAAGLLLEVQ